jgi:hypothetical protein
VSRAGKDEGRPLPSVGARGAALAGTHADVPGHPARRALLHGPQVLERLPVHRGRLPCRPGGDFLPPARPPSGPSTVPTWRRFPPTWPPTLGHDRRVAPGRVDCEQPSRHVRSLWHPRLQTGCQAPLSITGTATVVMLSEENHRSSAADADAKSGGTSGAIVTS